MSVMRCLQSLRFDELLTFNSSDTLVLTVNNRFARRMLSRLQKTLLGSQRAMEVPDIIPLSAWLVQLSDELSFAGSSDSEGDNTHSSHTTPASYLLDKFSSVYLWEQTIRSQEAEQAALIDVQQAAKMAAEADALIDDWQLEIPDAVQTDDYRSFVRWRSAYEHYLEKHDIDDSNRSIKRVVQAVEQGQLPLPWQQVVLVGFNEYTARFKQLLSALAEQGLQLYSLASETITAESHTCVVAQSPDDEWRLAAQWATQQLQQHPDGRFAIICPNLEEHAAFAHRVLAQTGFNWNIAVGRSVVEWPLVRAALAWLNALAEAREGKVRCATMGRALLAGYCIAEQDEKDARHQLDVRWREQQPVVLSTPQLQQQLDNDLPLLSQVWQQCLAYVAAQPQTLSPARWVAHLRTLLRQLGFPGEYRLDSYAYQTMQAFDQHLGQFTRLAPVFGKQSFSQVVKLVERFLQEALFQPQRLQHTRLDVLGFLEAEGGQWDGLWVLGLTDEVLPASPKPNPFIPYRVQEQAQVQRATPERELAWAKQVMHSLCQTSPTVIFSYAEQQDGAALRPSPLLAELACIEAPIIDKYQPENQLEQRTDCGGPALKADEPIRGGVGVLDKQAKNPLWAFVSHRLHAKSLAAYEDSSTMSLWRGHFIHNALERFWSEWVEPDLPTLQTALQSGQAQAQLRQSLALAQAEHLGHLAPTIQRLEAERAEQVLLQWLDFESKRPYFRITSQEESYQLAGIALQMRIDRIDQLADGSYVLIDYKTGVNSRTYNGWNKARAVDIQLPIYATILHQQGAHISAMAFAHPHYNAEFVGYGATEDIGLTSPSFTRQQQNYGEWGAFIERMATHVCLMRDEFLQGYAHNCFDKDSDMRYCDVKPFLRLNQEAINQ